MRLAEFESDEEFAGVAFGLRRLVGGVPAVVRQLVLIRMPICTVAKPAFRTQGAFCVRLKASELRDPLDARPFPRCLLLLVAASFRASDEMADFKGIQIASFRFRADVSTGGCALGAFRA